MANLTENASAPCGIGASATRYSGAEDVRIVAVIVAELKLRNVQRQILAADFVETPHDAALNQRPEAIDCLSVNRTVNVLTFGMPHHFVGELFQGLVSSVLV